MNCDHSVIISSNYCTALHVSKLLNVAWSPITKPTARHWRYRKKSLVWRNFYFILNIHHTVISTSSWIVAVTLRWKKKLPIVNIIMKHNYVTCYTNMLHKYFTQICYNSYLNGRIFSVIIELVYLDPEFDLAREFSPPVGQWACLS